MNEDVNPIGWPPRSFWAEVAELEVPLADALASDGAAGPDSQQVGGEAVLAPADLTGTVPPFGWGSKGREGSRDRQWRAMQREWYSKIGEALEADEYSVSIERQQIGPASLHGRHTLSFDRLFEEHEESEEYADDPEDEKEDFDVFASDVEYGQLDQADEYEEFVSSVRTEAGLTKGETAALSWVASGNAVSGSDYAHRMGEALGTTRKGAERAWAKARRKTVDRWANEPEDTDREALCSSIEGQTDRLPGDLFLTPGSTHPVDGSEQRALERSQRQPNPITLQGRKASVGPWTKPSRSPQEDVTRLPYDSTVTRPPKPVTWVRSVWGEL